MKWAYYNENDPKAAAWLRELIKAGHIAPGEVDERSITEVQPSDVESFIQAHWFAGIGGWSYALRLAGWPDDQPVWTGSCPCQSFSSAGKQRGTNDSRHLWPTWFNLIKEHHPATVFGEQVENAINHGWLDLVQDDLEGEDYAFAAAGLPAAGVGAPHIRQRLYFVGDSNNPRPQGRVLSGLSADERAPWATGLVEWLPCRDGKYRPTQPGLRPLVARLPAGVGRSGDPCEPFHEAEARVMRLKGYGNSVVPQLAAEFVSAYIHIAED